ncbi:RluA family pseudouridine synthase [Vibrio atypicus]|uniref:RluA family pseudouridine synthase n=1 Tax=Vibrio atypicus TaxID=558271 RepID=UPI001358F187|nr:pseudouridine synthase [Vibrio atypicus]
MHQPDQLFTRFHSPIDGYSLPEKFTFPFYYQPHPLCILAAEQLQQHLLTQQNWQHDFGLDSTKNGTGKMFGVLLVKSPQGELGFLSAFSGKIADQNLLPGFVPPVFDMLTEQSFFRTELADITAVSDELKTKQTNPKLLQLREALKVNQAQYKQEESEQRQRIIEGRATRKAERAKAEASLEPEALKERLVELSKQSVAEKNVLKYLKLEWDEKITRISQELSQLETSLIALKEQRKQMSNALQNKLFKQYRFLNANGQEQSLQAIFKPTATPTPPAGAGECAAPKLLHYAYLHGFQPLALAEFWWGVSPKSEIRQHKSFYPSCNSKCQPILGHMLDGLVVDDNPLEENWAEDKELEILFEDEAMVVVNKPSGLLSVPGKTIKDSAYTRLQERHSDVEGPFVIHRLDMATSGLLVFALTKRANKSLQKQFISRSVEKRYVALLEGEIKEPNGQIELPMRGDPDDRPRQLVCYEHGKPALTTWTLIETINGRSKLLLYPKTGRTHQLRVHCAHHLGLNTAMVGDALYGQKADRLHLHAEFLELDHPYSKERMRFQVDSEF